ncbi:MAG: sigma-54-dependent Fis family transcriptional regulator [Deltaproteobacteria bacterium]|nr:sigma-54-dependent Fis family transcriptional regulator [Deltaproteobacteria bacterium]MBW2417367.1 sigma-54-dependent Fis family transcriptional regulator [Deltaproteobacteria bacterium]
MAHPASAELLFARPSQARILVVEDDGALRAALAETLSQRWSDVRVLGDGAAAVDLIANVANPPFDVVLSDLRLPGADGVQVLRAARERDRRTGVVLMGAFAEVETAVEAMRLGARDFIEKPFDLPQLELRLARAMEHQGLPEKVGELRGERRARLCGGQLVAESEAMQAAVDLARRVAPSRSTVLITGETGSGKEIVAGLIHGASPRSRGPFVKVNCAALPETLLESELFGHERGAFTGADRQRRGRFEEASGGTLFLDEIGDVSPTTQVKLLRVLQDQEFYRLGGSQSLRTDARVVAATNRDLDHAVASGGFREDLYFRLNVIDIHLPPLRERPVDAIALAQSYLDEFVGKLGRPLQGFSEPALAAIAAHSWPGNVRELRNTVERAVLMAEGSRVELADLSIAERATAGPGPLCFELPPGGVSLEEVEKKLVVAALQRSDFVQKEAARLIQVSPRKLNYMIQRMGITHPSWRRNRLVEEVEEDSEKDAEARSG